MKILIVKLGSIGDIVHTLPTLAAMRRKFPNAEISWVVETRSAEVLRDNPQVDRLIEIDTKAMRRWRMSGETLLAPRWQFHQLRASSFDLAIDFQGLFKSALISRLSGARRRYGFARAGLREPASRYLNHRQIKLPLDTHVIVKNLALASGALGVELETDPSTFEFPLATGPEHRREAESELPPNGGPVAILNPGGGWVTKLWSPERFGGLADALWSGFGMHSLVTFGPGEQERADRVVTAAASGKARAVSLSLKGFYELAKLTGVYVGGDTGPTHLAVAARTPVVGLFGPTEWWRNGSPFPIDICVERNDIGCRTDCHRRTCNKWICMDIEVERVLASVARRLDGNPKFARKERLTVA
jgi:lipopolysaccharide heptosyltransferase I